VDKPSNNQNNMKKQIYFFFLSLKVDMLISPKNTRESSDKMKPGQNTRANHYRTTSDELIPRNSKKSRPNYFFFFADDLP